MMFQSKIRLSIAIATFVCQNLWAPAYSAPLILKADEELNLLQVSDFRHAELRISNDYVYAHLPDYHVDLLSQGPNWAVSVISSERKLFCNMSLNDWVRRGSPLNFLKVTSMPDWPVVQTGTKKPFLKQTAIVYALPYLTKARVPVPITKGYTGALLVLDAVVPAAAGKIIRLVYQTPKVDGLPLQLRMWDPDQLSSKMNSVFIFSGAKKNDDILVTTKLWISKKHPLPSTKALKFTREPREVWVSNDDTEQFQDLMK